MPSPSVRYRVVPTSDLVPTDAADHPDLRRGVKVARFGERSVVWGAAGDGVGRGARTAPGLLLVTQVGRSFQDAFPEVKPVLDRGRHLVISAADKPRKRSNHCWRVEALPAGTVVDSPSRGATRVDPTVSALLAQLDPASYQAEVTWLASLPTRHSHSASFVTAVEHAEQRMVALGYQTRRQPITVGTKPSQNLIGDRAGSGGGVVLVTAHLDSINLAGGPSASAPGADDNASGAAGVLELGRVLATRTWQHDIRLILFGGEEEGLFGSKQYVAALPAAERARIRAVLNLDMVASKNSTTPTVLLEGAQLSSGLIDDLATAAATYTGLAVETSLNPFASDHVPFITAGIPAVLTIEGSDSANTHIHSADDTLNWLNWPLAAEILRMNTAALAGWLQPVATRPRPAGSIVSWGPNRIDIFAT
ncbi:M28 family metallopeptidase [Kribbella sp. NPDC005582]|uniref:M28 family metallopeptidase n=1 Tax=Kribbella sp. NPDC005582 TaxID=3156893 RepID=UPI0033BF72AA